MTHSSAISDEPVAYTAVSDLPTPVPCATRPDSPCLAELVAAGRKRQCVAEPAPFWSSLGALQAIIRRTFWPRTHNAMCATKAGTIPREPASGKCCGPGLAAVTAAWTPLRRAPFRWP